MAKRNDIRKTQQRSSNIKSKPSSKNGKQPLRSGVPEKQTPSNKRNIPGASRVVPEKSVISKSRPAKRKKFRGGNYVLYYVLALIVIAVVLIILANTVLFKCSQIEVSGNDKYTADEIVRISGLQTGENLLHINVSAARDNIVNSLAYIDDAQVKKSFPTKINIAVTEAEKQYCIVENGVTAAISRKGKIIEHCGAGELPVVKGFEAETTEVGKWLKSKAEGKTEIPAEIFETADKTGLKNITEIDISDKFSVKVEVENRVILNLGPAEELESKLRVAVEIINNQLGKDEYVTLLLTNPEKVPVQNNSLPQQSKPVSSSSSSGTSSQPVSDPTQNPDPDPDPDPEPEPEPDPDPDPAPAPAPDPEPDPDPDPDPEPEPDPDPEPEPDPDPDPNPDPNPDPEPAPPAEG